MGPCIHALRNNNIRVLLNGLFGTCQIPNLDPNFDFPSKLLPSCADSGDNWLVIGTAFWKGEPDSGNSML